jgi:hypothetical protein
MGLLNGFSIGASRLLRQRVRPPSSRGNVAKIRWQCSCTARDSCTAALTFLHRWTRPAHDRAMLIVPPTSLFLAPDEQSATRVSTASPMTTAKLFPHIHRPRDSPRAISSLIPSSSFFRDRLLTAPQKPSTSHALCQIESAIPADLSFEGTQVGRTVGIESPFRH